MPEVSTIPNKAPSVAPNVEKSEAPSKPVRKPMNKKSMRNPLAPDPPTIAEVNRKFDEANGPFVVESQIVGNGNTYQIGVVANRHIKLTLKMGSSFDFRDWMEEYGYTEAERDVIKSEMRNQRHLIIRRPAEEVGNELFVSLG